MIDAKSILGSLLEAGTSRSTHARLGKALGRNDLGRTVGDVLAKAQGTSPMAAGGIGALAGAMLGGSRGGFTKGAIGGAAIALLGKLALDALRERQLGTGAASTGATPVGTSTAGSGLGWGPAAAAETVPEVDARLVLRAMLSAAKADGQIDGNEMQRIMGKLDESGADAESKNVILEEMRGPVDIEGLARSARSPAEAAQLYAASLLAIDIDTEAERDYLRRLAQALGLGAATVAHLHKSLEAPA
jgi:uncharacterized membrane protein YebE (DUF533 family)